MGRASEKSTISWPTCSNESPPFHHSWPVMMRKTWSLKRGLEDGQVNGVITAEHYKALHESPVKWGSGVKCHMSIELLGEPKCKHPVKIKGAGEKYKVQKILPAILHKDSVPPNHLNERCEPLLPSISVLTGCSW